MMKKKLCIPLLILLLLTGCMQDTQHIKMPITDFYDHPPAEAPLIIEPFTSDVAVPNIDPEPVKATTENPDGIEDAVIFDLTPILLEKIQDRKVIEAPYFALVKDAQLHQKLLEYNAMTADFHIVFTHYAANLIIEQNGFIRPDGDPLSNSSLSIMHFSDELKALIEQIGTLGMYSDARQRIENDPLFSSMDLHWTEDLHSEPILQNSGGSSEALAAYFELTDALLQSLSETELSFTVTASEKEVLIHLLNHIVMPDELISQFKDGDLASLSAYQSMLIEQRDLSVQHGINIVSALLQISERDFTPEFWQMAEEIAQIAMYRNAQELAYGSPLLAKYIAGELGGSAGQWPRDLHPPEIYAFSDQTEKLVSAICS